MDNIRIFRVEGTSDNTNSDFIDFNNNTRGKKTSIENAFITQIRKIDSDAVGDNQAAEQDLGDKQHLGESESKYIIEGFFTQRNSIGHPYITQLDIWNASTKQNDNWPEGQFGIVDSGDATNTFLPVGTGGSTQGLIWERLETWVDLGKNQKYFKLELTVSKGDGT